MPDDVSVNALAAEVADLRATVAGLQDDIAGLFASTGVQSATAPERDDAPLRYASLDEWVTEYFTPAFPRPLGGEYRWCSRWDEHVEALTRLEALWRSWEVARRDANTGMATWLTGYLDPQLAVLLSRSGPFSTCTTDRHQLLPSLPHNRGNH